MLTHTFTPTPLHSTPPRSNRNRDPTPETVIDVAGGDKVPRKGGPGISQSDLLVVNKIDIAPHVGASLEVMRRDADRMRDHGPTVFTSVRNDVGVEQVIELLLQARRVAGADKGGKPLA